MSDQVGMMPATQISVKPNTPVRRELSGSSNTASGDIYNPDLTALAMSNLVNSTPEYSDTVSDWRNQPSTVPQEGNWGNEIAPQPEQPTSSPWQQVETVSFGAVSKVLFNGPEVRKEKNLADSRQTIAGMPGFNQTTQPTAPEYSDQSSNMPDVSRMLAERQLGQQALANQQFEQMGAESGSHNQKTMAERQIQAAKIVGQLKQNKHILDTLPASYRSVPGRSDVFDTSKKELFANSLGTSLQLVWKMGVSLVASKLRVDSLELNRKRQEDKERLQKRAAGLDGGNEKAHSAAEKTRSNAEKAPVDIEQVDYLEAATVQSAG
jgi:hypothetical protein